MGTFQILEHTADKGLEVHASELSDLFVTAARGLFTLMIDLARYPPTESVRIELTAPDLEMLMVRWLNELVYQFEVYHRLFTDYARVSVSQLEEGWHLEAEAHYCPIVPKDLEWEGAPVKSVTYHGLILQHTDSGWRLRFYVDV